ncbi:MAG: RidA family protein [Bacteroidota bacterium]|nr:RidA family protein [Bacteroidota bacterium]
MTIIKRIISPFAPEPAPGRFSNCLLVDGIAYIAGQTGQDPVTNQVPADGFEQAQTIFRKLTALVEAAGGTAADIVKLTVFVTDADQIPHVAKARAEVFHGDFPASTLVQVASLFDPALKIEIECVAHIGASAR